MLFQNSIKGTQYIELENLDPEGDPKFSTSTKKSWYQLIGTEAWRPTICSGILLSALVLLSNVAILMVGWSKRVDEDGNRVFYEGSCNASSRVYTAWHIFINVLG